MQAPLNPLLRAPLTPLVVVCAERSYIWPSTSIVLLSFMGLLLEPTTEMRSGMHVIALLSQVTLLGSLMNSMPSIGYHTWCAFWPAIPPVFALTSSMHRLVGWGIDMMLLTAFALLECILAAFAKQKIQAARDAAAKKLDLELGAMGEPRAAGAPPPKSNRELGLPTWLLVLGELDTIAQRVFPCLFISNAGLKELRLALEPRARWSGAIYAYCAFAFILCAGVLAQSVKTVVDNLGLRLPSAAATGEKTSEQENPSFQREENAAAAGAAGGGGSELVSET